MTQQVAESIQALRQQLQTAIVGQSDLIERLILAVLAGGHVLLEGAPGLAKTTAVNALAKGIDANFKRVQFTPDLMPSDLVGSEIFDANSARFNFIPGPLFNEIVLADEINRAPPKVQSALLEAMAEHQITVAGDTHQLPKLFMVLATQNPLEQSGTYPLPEAQLDRFLFHLKLNYPSIEQEIEIARRSRTHSLDSTDNNVQSTLTPSDVLAIRQTIDAVFVEPSIERYAVELVTATRHIDQYHPDWGLLVVAGASPRGSIALLRAAMAWACMQGRDYVLPEDVTLLAPDVLRHRIFLDYAAINQGVDGDAIIDMLLGKVKKP